MDRRQGGFAPDARSGQAMGPRDIGPAGLAAGEILSGDRGLRQEAVLGLFALSEGWRPGSVEWLLDWVEARCEGAR